MYAISLERLASLWATLRYQETNNSDFKFCMDFWYPYTNPEYFKEFFKDEFPSNALQFIPYPAKFNTRMQRQCGCFIYDTLDYKSLGLKDLEDYIEKYEDQRDTSEESKQIGHQTIIKILIPKKTIAGELLAHLELMGILGMQLYDSAEGVSIDVANSYYYKSKTLFSRDYYEQNK